MSVTTHIDLVCHAVRTKRGWLGQISRDGAILWETSRSFDSEGKALDAAYMEADRTVRTLINQPEMEVKP